MPTLETTIANFKFNSYTSVMDSLKTIDSAKEQYPQILTAAKPLSPTKFRLLTKSLLKTNSDFLSADQLMVHARINKDPVMRRDIVRSFKESGRDMDFLTSVCLMTGKDGGLFVRDYLEQGGKRKNIAKWLIAAASLWMKQKRQGLYDSENDWSIGGVIDSIGDGLSAIGGAVAEGFNSVVDAIEAAGESLVDFVDDIVTFSVNQLTDLVEAIIEAGREVGELLDALVDATDKVLTKAYRAVINATGSAMELIKSAVKNSILGKCFTLLNNLSGAVGWIIKGALDYSKAVLKEAVTFLVQAGRSAMNIVRLIAETTIDGLAAALDAIKELGFEIGSLVKTACKAMYKAGVSLTGCISWILSKAADAGAMAINGIIEAGARIKNILGDAYNLSKNTLSSCIGFLVDAGRSTWYLLSWAARKSIEIVSVTFEKLIETGLDVVELVAWSIRRAGSLLTKGFDVLLQLGYTAGQIITAIVTDPRNALSKSLKAIKELGASIEDFAVTAVNLGKDLFIKTWNVIKNFAMNLWELLAYAAEASKEFFMKTARYLLAAGIHGFDIVAWALDWSFQIFGWVLEVFTFVLDSFVSVFEWLVESTLGPKAKQWLADWLQTWVVDKVDWLKDKIVVPLMAIGKFALFITIALLNIVLLALAYWILKSLVDTSKTDYLHWPDNFADFKNQMGNRLINLPQVAAGQKYVIISDVHKESRDDIEGGIGHFYKNKTLFKQVMDHYAEDASWTVISNGDAEEFWFSNDLSPYGDSTDKVGPIINENRDVFDNLTNNFYKRKSPRQFIKLRGNHDDVWDKSSAVNKLARSGFPNLDIREFACFKHQGKDVLVMHGHQFDPYNCDANNYFGKFISNYVAESLDAINDALVNLFGSGARIEGGRLDLFVPFFIRSEWEEKIQDIVAEPELVEGFTFNEKVLKDQIRKFDCSIVLGHTHDPKIVVDGEDNDRMYVNSGTCGWWEGCMWTVEYTLAGIALKIWSDDNPTEPYMTFGPNEGYAF